VPLADFGIGLPLWAINVFLASGIGLKVAVLTQRRWTAITLWARVAVGLLWAAVLFMIAATAKLHAPATAPAIAPAIVPLGWLLGLLPFVALLAPLRRIVDIIRGRSAQVAA
jgi:hypothetical protein